jgi:hypothetical protein
MEFSQSVLSVLPPNPPSNTNNHTIPWGENGRTEQTETTIDSDGTHNTPNETNEHENNIQGDTQTIQSSETHKCTSEDDGSDIEKLDIPTTTEGASRESVQQEETQTQAHLENDVDQTQTNTDGENRRKPHDEIGITLQPDQTPTTSLPTVEPLPYSSESELTGRRLHDSQYDS